MTGGPISGADSHISQVYLNAESTTMDYIVGCTGLTGVVDATTWWADLGQTASYSLVINFNSCGGFYEGDGEAWIDYDQSNSFEPGESLGTWTGTPPVMNTFNFTVPATAPLGTTRMRVMLYEDWTGVVFPPLDPCAAFTWGSVYDFTINIIPWVDCSGTMGDDMITPIDVTSLPYTDANNSASCYTDVDPVYNSADVYYRILGADITENYLDISTCLSTFDTYLSVQNSAGEVLYYNDDSPDCSPYSKLSIPIADTDTFFIVVQGWGAFEGDYTLEINAANNSSVSDLAKFEFNIYPNPANEVLNVSVDTDGWLSLYDPQSKLLLERYMTNGKNEINLHEYPEGIYLLKFTQNGVNQIQKIIIRR